MDGQALGLCWNSKVASLAKSMTKYNQYRGLMLDRSFQNLRYNSILIQD